MREMTQWALMTRMLQTYEDTVHTTTEAQISAVETDLTEHMQKLEERIGESQKLRKELRGLSSSFISTHQSPCCQKQEFPS